MRAIEYLVGLVLAVFLAAIGELVSDEIRMRLDRIPLTMLALAARRLPPDQREVLYLKAWLPELHHVLKGDDATPITRLIHGVRFAASLWFSVPQIRRELALGHAAASVVVARTVNLATAVEAYAMKMATEFYSKVWSVEDVHAWAGYDLLCRRGDEVKHVEVKATIRDGTELVVTPNEVRHARESKCSALFFLSNIKVEQADDGTVTATGGEHRVYDPWYPDENGLTPLSFRYQIPRERPELT